MPHIIYIEGDIYLNVADIHRFKQAIATSIEAIFILLGESNTVLRQDPISWDKLHELLIAPINQILGLVLDLCRMTTGIPPGVRFHDNRSPQDNLGPPPPLLQGQRS